MSCTSFAALQRLPIIFLSVFFYFNLPQLKNLLATQCLFFSLDTELFLNNVFLQIYIRCKSFEKNKANHHCELLTFRGGKPKWFHSWKAWILALESGMLSFFSLKVSLTEISCTINFCVLLLKIRCWSKTLRQKSKALSWNVQAILVQPNKAATQTQWPKHKMTTLQKTLGPLQNTTMGIASIWEVLHAEDFTLTA